MPPGTSRAQSSSTGPRTSSTSTTPCPPRSPAPRRSPGRWAGGGSATRRTSSSSTTWAGSSPPDSGGRSLIMATTKSASSTAAGTAGSRRIARSKWARSPRCRRPSGPRPRAGLRATAAEVASRLGEPGLQLLDARDAGQFTGARRRGARGGHIPGARNVPRELFFAEGGGFRPLEEIRKVVEGLGLQPDRPTVAYCNGGVAATVVLFHLARLGFPRAGQLRRLVERVGRAGRPSGRAVTPGIGQLRGRTGWRGRRDRAGAVPRPRPGSGAARDRHGHSSPSSRPSGRIPREPGPPGRDTSGRSPGRSR